MMRMALVIPSLGPGGAERVITLLSSQWARRGHDVTLATFELPGTEPFFDLDNRIRLRQLGAVNCTRRPSEILRTNVARLKLLRRLFVEVKPDVIVSFMTEANVISICASRGLKIPIVVSERNRPDRPDSAHWRKSISRLSYRWSSALVVQTAGLVEWARSVSNGLVYVLPNPVCRAPSSHRRQPGSPARSDYQIVAAGRLVPQKGFDILIESFRRISPHYHDWTLTIYGEGPQRAKLEETIYKHGLQNRVKLPGVLKDLRAALLQASLFVLPSRFEGYPNVLLEALTCGCPIIAADCPGGTGDILERAHYGVLVPPEDPESLATAMVDMIESREMRASYSARAEQAVELLDSDIIAEKWIEIFLELQKTRKTAGRTGRAGSRQA